MSEDYELRTFSPGPDKLIHQVVARQEMQNDEDRVCRRFIERLKAGFGNAADDRRIRDCFLMDAPPGIVSPPLPPFGLILRAADALPPGPTKAELLYMATWDSVPDRPTGGLKDAVRRLRALIPLLDGETRGEAAAWLDTTSIDLIEGRPDDAIARVRRGFSSAGTSAMNFADQPEMQARSLIYDFLKARDVERAVAVTNMLSSSADCAMVDEGLAGALEWLPRLDDTIMATYLARLDQTGTLKRLCPNGLGSEIAANVWLEAGDEAKALKAAAAVGNPLTASRTRLDVIERRLSAGDLEGARSAARATIANLPSLTAGNSFDRVAAARARARLIHQLVRMGETPEAERLAKTYSGPGWRGFAYSVIVATAERDRAGANWGGPFLDLNDVPADR